VCAHTRRLHALAGCALTRTRTCDAGAQVPSQGAQTIKVPASSYEFGSILVDGNTMMIGKIFTDGRLSGRVKYDVSDALSLKLQTQITKEKGYSQVMLDVDGKGLDWQGQLKLGNGAFYGVNYIQSVTPALSLGGEAFWLGAQRKSGMGIAARHADDTCVATAQLASTGLVSLTYVQKVSDKVSLASDFMYNWNSREATASVGYDYILRQCRLRARVDSHGSVVRPALARLFAMRALCIRIHAAHSACVHFRPSRLRSWRST
jgi:mitochondrial import receptor subunit TOM40